MLALVLNLSLLVLQVEDGAPLGVVERRRPVTGSQDERAEDADCNRLQPESVETKRE